MFVNADNLVDITLMWGIYLAGIIAFVGLIYICIFWGYKLSQLFREYNEAKRKEIEKSYTEIMNDRIKEVKKYLKELKTARIIYCLDEDKIRLEIGDIVEIDSIIDDEKINGLQGKIIGIISDGYAGKVKLKMVSGEEIFINRCYVKCIKHGGQINAKRKKEKEMVK